MTSSEPMDFEVAYYDLLRAYEKLEYERDELQTTADNYQADAEHWEAMYDELKEDLSGL